MVKASKRGAVITRHINYPRAYLQHHLTKPKHRRRVAFARKRKR